MEDSKIKLVELAKKGNQEAFLKLIEEVKLKLYKTGISILKNDEDTCDAIQETLINAYKSLNTIKKNEYFSTWIMKILINKCYDIIRKNKKIINIDEKIKLEQDMYYEMYSQESELEVVLNKIDKDLKMVTVLYYYDDLSVREISEVLNIPEGTVKSRLSRARSKIYAILKEEEGERFG